jgi:hypothetical protein
MRKINNEHDKGKEIPGELKKFRGGMKVEEVLSCSSSCSSSSSSGSFSIFHYPCGLA